MRPTRLQLALRLPIFSKVKHPTMISPLKCEYFFVFRGILSQLKGMRKKTESTSPQVYLNPYYIPGASPTRFISAFTGNANYSEKNRSCWLSKINGQSRMARDVLLSDVIKAKWTKEKWCGNAGTMEPRQTTIDKQTFLLSIRWVHFGCKKGLFSAIFPYFPRSKKRGFQAVKCLKPLILLWWAVQDSNLRPAD